MPTEKDPFVSIDAEAMETVAGGARASGRAGGNDDQLTAMLTQITSSIKDLASSKNDQSDPMQLMLMMLMMGGFGGGGGGGIAAPVAATPVVNVDTAVCGGGRKKGKKGW